MLKDVTNKHLNASDRGIFSYSKNFKGLNNKLDFQSSQNLETNEKPKVLSKKGKIKSTEKSKENHLQAHNPEEKSNKEVYNETQTPKSFNEFYDDENSFGYAIPNGIRDEEKSKLKYINKCLKNKKFAPYNSSSGHKQKYYLNSSVNELQKVGKKCHSLKKIYSSTIGFITEKSKIKEFKIFKESDTFNHYEDIYDNLILNEVDEDEETDEENIKRGVRQTLKHLKEAIIIDKKKKNKPTEKENK